MLSSMAKQHAPEIELNLTAYMQACYGTTDPIFIRQILKHYKMEVLVPKGFDGMGDTGEKNQIIGLGDHQLRATLKMIRWLLTPNIVLNQPACQECGNSGLSKEKRDAVKKGQESFVHWKTGCWCCGRAVVCLNIDGNSSTCTPDVGLASGNEGNHTVYTRCFQNILKMALNRLLAKISICFYPR